ncbi:MAG: TRAM domain-containing protein [Bifidobacteriaceae bacterium]|nr:TRAM domain-containing protein [Bifidobacteriaceae bacterium]
MSDDLVKLRPTGLAHGGWCVARYEGRVVFVRHTLPGETVLARVTERRSRLWRAEAVRILEPSPDRVPHVWPPAGPGGVGGADLGHVALAASRRWKAAVVQDTLRRIGHLDREVTVRALPGEDERDGLAWRTRVTLAVDDGGYPGMHPPRSGRVIRLSGMPLAVPEIDGHEVFGSRHAGASRLMVAAGSDGTTAVLTDGRGPDATRALVHHVTVPVPHGLPLGGSGRRPGTGHANQSDHGPGGGQPGHREGRLEIDYRTMPGTFWQVHREAPGALAGAVLAAGADLLAEGRAIIWDLYCGAGLLTVPLALTAGERASVWAVEADPHAGRAARRAGRDVPTAHVRVGDVESVAPRLPAPDLVVLDPPRRGAGRDVCAGIVHSRPRAVVYVACDPAALARDAATLRDGGYRLDDVVGLDMFPRTHHVECVARFTRDQHRDKE